MGIIYNEEIVSGGIMDTIKRLNENLSKLDEARKSALGFLSELTDDKSFVETGAFTSGTILKTASKLWAKVS